MAPASFCAHSGVAKPMATRRKSAPIVCRAWKNTGMASLLSCIQKALNSCYRVRNLLCSVTNYYFYFRFIGFVNWNILLPSAKEARLPLEGQRAPARGVPLLAHETRECTAIAKCLGATFLGG